MINKLVDGTSDTRYLRRITRRRGSADFNNRITQSGQSWAKG